MRRAVNSCLRSGISGPYPVLSCYLETGKVPAIVENAYLTKKDSSIEISGFQTTKSGLVTEVSYPISKGYLRENENKFSITEVLYSDPYL